MKKFRFYSLVLLGFAFIACSSKDECPNSDIEKFDNFLGVQYGTSELELEAKLGKFTGGEYTTDSSAFIYYFKRIENAPVTVWVNAKTGKVETIFMEILGYEEVFEKDLEEAKKEFKMSDCDSRFFGMKYEELTETMGKPNFEETLDEGVKSLTYDSKDYKYNVNFKIYPSQADMCSSISVNWFY
jgi:hypothetical protein